MKFLLIGLGSMGKRRIRCLQSLGYSKIIGYDVRSDRLDESQKKYNITVISSLNKNDIMNCDAVIVSTPPHLHAPYVEQAISCNKPVFVEASVLLEDVRKIRHANINNVFVAPSCTMLFHPIIKQIIDIVKSKKYGEPVNFTYHSGQYLPDWHPWENMCDYYVSQKETGAAREIVPFELTWLSNLFGMPDTMNSIYGKCSKLPVEIDDVYSLSLRFGNVIGSITVDVTSRFATRSLIINMEKAQIRWSWENKCCKVYESDTGLWITHEQHEFTANNQYNQNIGEEMYIEEISSFLNGIKNPSTYPNSLENDIFILETLNKLEKNF